MVLCSDYPLPELGLALGLLVLAAAAAAAAPGSVPLDSAVFAVVPASIAGSYFAHAAELGKLAGSVPSSLDVLIWMSGMFGMIVLQAPGDGPALLLMWEVAIVFAAQSTWALGLATADMKVLPGPAVRHPLVPV